MCLEVVFRKGDHHDRLDDWKRSNEVRWGWSDFLSLPLFSFFTLAADDDHNNVDVDDCVDDENDNVTAADDDVESR